MLEGKGLSTSHIPLPSSGLVEVTLLLPFPLFPETGTCAEFLFDLGGASTARGPIVSTLKGNNHHFIKITIAITIADRLGRVSLYFFFPAK